MIDRTTIPVAAALGSLDTFASIIDVRSPSEFLEDHIPGAVNYPVLSDAERAEVGTLDRQQSTFEARRRGAAMVAHNIARHLERSFSDRPREWNPLVYCWRGGQRSEAMTHILSRVGWGARQLEGGYRAYRRVVVADLASQPLRFQFRVVCGATGSGKTRLLGQLAAAGAQVLDLETLASHRGSVLGDLPTQEQPSQKRFESMLWAALRSFDAARPVFVESESRKVGSVRVPDELIARMRESDCVRLELPLDARVRLLRDDYAHFERDPVALFEQLDCLTALHGRERIGQWKTLAQNGKWNAMVEALLREHYDPAYMRSISRNFSRIADAAVVRIASDDVADFATAARSLAGAASNAS